MNSVTVALTITAIALWAIATVAAYAILYKEKR